MQAGLAMGDIQVNLLLKYPLISRVVEEDAVLYKGSLFVKDEDYKITIAERRNSYSMLLPNQILPFEVELRAIIDNLQPKNVLTILDSVSSYISTRVPSNRPVDLCDIYRHVLAEYAELTNFYFNLTKCHLEHDLSKVSISIMDERQRRHSIEVAVTFNDKKNLFRIASCDLPQEKESFKASSSLKTVYEQFLRSVEALQPFFDLLDSFDRHCWVMDPVQPTRSCNYRRISTGENVSVIITIDPGSITKIPGIKFLGPEKQVEEFRTTINENLGNWTCENDIYAEILKLLGMEAFPPKPAAVERGIDVLKESGECSICFSFRLNEKLPETVCKNQSCQNCYHTECLYEWLISVNARRFFAEVLGQCPNCEKTISCPIPK